MRVWTVSEAKAGTLTQCLGVARLIDPKPKKIIVKGELPFWRKGILSPYRRRPSPEPELIISCGGQALSHVKALAAACSRRPFLVHLAAPQPEYEDLYDLAFISRHDWNDGKATRPNFRQMVGVPHQIHANVLADMREQARRRWAPGGGKVLTVLTGGPNRAYLYDDATVQRLLDAIRRLAGEGWTVLVSTSRRSRPGLLESLLKLRSDSIVVWDRKGENPYRDFLAAADAFLVAKDSITMACEAVTSGKPTYVFDLPGKPGPHFDKFEWFHADMSDTLGLTRRFDGAIGDYSYEPPAEAARIAAVVTETIATERPDLAESARASSKAALKALEKAEAAERIGSAAGPSGVGPAFDATFAHHHGWLSAHGLLGRPWFFLGSAPEPTIPAGLPDDTVYAYIKFAGRSARMHGLPPGDITLLTRWRELQEAAALDLKLILRLRPELTYRGRFMRLLGRTGMAESQLTSAERDDYVIHTLGSLFGDVGAEKRPSNGIGMICFALAHGIDRMVIAGISVDTPGHEYERSNAPRRHAAEDLAALREVAARYPSVFTSEQALHRATGLPLYRP